MPRYLQMLPYDYLIVGAGLFGSTFAWHARQRGKRVLVIDKRNHVGGNCYTHQVEGIHVHAYGPHIFHTSDQQVWSFVNRFASFHKYVHRVKARHGDKLLSLPVNLMTFNKLWDVKTPEEAEARLQQARTVCPHPKNMEEWALSQVGPEIYELLFKHYTTKQWGRDPNQMPAAVLKRLPIRLTWDDNYYDDKWQGIPTGGYTRIFDGLLEGCDVRLGIDYLAHREELDKLARVVVYTGQVDAYYDYALGRLEYRTLDFETKVIPHSNYQGCAQLNWTGPEVPWTRTIEHKHFELTDVPATVVTWETPAAYKPGDEPYYPINDTRNNDLYMRYKDLADHEPGVLFGGRLGTYRYFDMHQVIAQAMHLAKQEGLIDV